MSREETIRFLRNMCREHDVKVHFLSKFNEQIDGEVDTEKQVIYIDKKLPRKRMAEVVFHELGHIHCIRKGKWKKFHENDDYSAIKAFKAENWIEHWAKREWDSVGMRKIFGQYRFSYLKSERKNLIEWFRNQFNLPKLV